VIAEVWRAGVRIIEALALAESDIDRRRGAGRRGEGGRRREVGMTVAPVSSSTRGLFSTRLAGRRLLFWVLRGPPRGHLCAPTEILRKGLSNRQAADIIYAIAASESVDLRFVDHPGWDPRDYARMLEQVLTAALSG
jgi:integrase